jgi:hypothetical protein
MGPDTSLPLPADFSSADEYVESLLQFTTSSWLLQTLCGGVHILDFYTRSPDLYSTILPESWRTWFKSRHIMEILDLLMREDLGQFAFAEADFLWRGGPPPPKELLQYIRDVRKHLLGRQFPPPGSGLQQQKPSIARHISIGMKVKKVHEVDNFARYVDRLTSDIGASTGKEITHLVDFGSGQNYLGRALAAPPYSKHLVAVESRPHNIEGAKDMDIKARLVSKPITMINKKEYRAKFGKGKKGKSGEVDRDQQDRKYFGTIMDKDVPVVGSVVLDQASNGTACDESACAPVSSNRASDDTTHLQIYTEGRGSVQYVEHIIKDGDLGPVINQIVECPQNGVAPKTIVLEKPLETTPKTNEVNALVMSLHSCGNLVHHGLRSLLLNPSVSAVAMVGCCYNLVTERLGPPTYKLPTLRPNHPRLVTTSNAFDPHGFPMSEKLVNYSLPQRVPQSAGVSEDSPKGIRLNITARMMAVQAPFNWGSGDSELFFARHFYRALLQRIFLDRGIVSAPVSEDGLVGDAVSANGHTSKVNWTPPNGRGPGLSSDGTCTPLTIGTLRKFAYSDFLSYVRAAVTKLTAPNTFCEVAPDFIAEKMGGLSDDDIRDYEKRYESKKHELSVMWSLMAFSAGVVEAVIVTDRWLWLTEQKEVERAWVEPVFEYAMSPRNLVVVGIKK